MTKDIGLVICIACKKINHQTKVPVSETEKPDINNLEPKPQNTEKFICRFCGGTKFWAGLRRDIPDNLT